MELAVLRLSNALHQAMLDKYAVTTRCVPNKTELETIIKKISETRKNLTISTFTPHEYSTIFKLMFSFMPSDFNLPHEDKLSLIVKTFQFLAAENNRTNGTMDADDLWVLCVMHNILCYDENANAYLKKFKNWRS